MGARSYISIDKQNKSGLPGEFLNCIRSAGGNSDAPTPSKFANVVKNSVCSQVFHTALNSNCTDDATPILEYLNHNKNPPIEINNEKPSTSISFVEEELELEEKLSSIYGLEDLRDESIDCFDNVESYDKMTQDKANDEVPSDLQHYFSNFNPLSSDEKFESMTSMPSSIQHFFLVILILWTVMKNSDSLSSR